MGSPVRRLLRARLRTILIVSGAAAAVLLLNGLLFTLISVPPSLDPAAARCTTARTEIETANENDDSFDDVDLDGREGLPPSAHPGRR